MSAKELAESFVKVCAEVQNVKRDTQGQVGTQKYKYATLESVLDMVQPLLKANGLALAQYVEGDGLRATLIHSTGAHIELGSYNLGPIDKHQARGSAITYGRRYQLCSIFGITQEDDDGAEASKDKVISKGIIGEGKRVFINAAKRKDWENKLADLLKNCGDMDSLKGIWTEYLPILTDLKSSEDDYENQSYIYLESLKDQCKATIARLESVHGLSVE